MNTHISFYLRNNRIHIFIDSLRGIGSPKFISFLIDEDGNNLVLIPYNKKDFHSHRVPIYVYNGKRGLSLTSIRLCKILATKFSWDTNKSYRVPGIIIRQQKIVVFNLQKAVSINDNSMAEKSI